jgi:hypothetical protein
VVAVDYSVPFGTVPGKQLLLGNYLVFVDEQQPRASFVVVKSAIESRNAAGPAMRVQANEAIWNRSGAQAIISHALAVPDPREKP